MDAADDLATEHQVRVWALNLGTVSYALRIIDTRLLQPPFYLKVARASNTMAHACPTEHARGE